MLLSRSQCEDILLDRYLEGLQEIQVQCYTSLRKPRTLDEAITVVAQYEALPQETGSIRRFGEKPPPRRVILVGLEE